MPLLPLTLNLFGMQLVTSVKAMRQRALRLKQLGIPLGFVPTMGYLHTGHLALIRKARRLVGHRGKVVVSIYVNPTQFAPQEDLASYPRDLPRDKRLCRQAGVDILFLPTDQEMYPVDGKGGFSTYVVEEKLSRRLEGASRPTHFWGVTTVVAKLFNLVLPDYAVFGAKDFQQAIIIQRMVRDLNFPVKIALAPTVREPDGLALSSRNKYLSPEERNQAAVLWEAIRLASQRMRGGFVSVARLKQELTQLIKERGSARIDYIEFFDPTTFEPVSRLQKGAHLALAVFIGKTRLIDNARLY